MVDLFHGYLRLYISSNERKNALSSKKRAVSTEDECFLAAFLTSLNFFKVSSLVLIADGFNVFFIPTIYTITHSKSIVKKGAQCPLFNV